MPVTGKEFTVNQFLLSSLMKAERNHIDAGTPEDHTHDEFLTYTCISYFLQIAIASIHMLTLLGVRITDD